LLEKNIPSPFIPRPGDNFDKRYCEGLDKIGQETIERYQGHYNKDGFDYLFPNYTFYGDLIQKEKQRLQSRLQIHKNNVIEPFVMKQTTSRNNYSTTNVPKKRLSYVSISNVSLIKPAQSPMPNKEVTSTNTPIPKQKLQTHRSSNSSNSLLKVTTTPLKYQDSSSSKFDKLPNIEMGKSKIKQSTFSPSVHNSMKKTISKNSITMSLDTGSTNGTVNRHKRTLSNFTNKVLK
jgi:hypothetical protein